MNHYPSNLTDNQWQVIESPLLSKRIIFTFKTNFFSQKAYKINKIDYFCLLFETQKRRKWKK